LRKATLAGIDGAEKMGAVCLIESSWLSLLAFSVAHHAPF
jgi:hypothetical protein